MIKNCIALPDNYHAVRHIDLQKDKKSLFLVNGIALIILILAVGIGHQIVPIRTFYSMEKGIVLYVIRFLITIGSAILYIFLHELVHGMFIRYYSGIRPIYGFTGIYAYAGSGAYFNKKSYLVIALAPIVVWGIVITVVLIFITEYWFWAAYIIQIINISGAAGDLYVTWVMTSLHEDILIQDTGVSMTVYSYENNTSKGNIANEF